MEMIRLGRSFLRVSSIAKMIPHKFILTLGLYLIGGLHTMIFAIFQNPINFLFGNPSETLLFSFKIVLYVCAISVSVSHQFIARKLGLRKTLYIGLIFNIFGMASLWFGRAIHSDHPILILSNMIFFGIALTSVINPLITYIVLEFPKRVGTAITALFAVFNTGVMLAPILLESMLDWSIHLVCFPLLIAFLLLSLWFVHKYFFDPPYPARLEHLREGTTVWKELHYRLALFVIAIIAYAMAETTFALWGFVEMKEFLGRMIANETVSFFWLFMVIGQVVLLIPLYYFRSKVIFCFLIGLIIVGLFLFPYQRTLGSYIATLALAGFGCSAVFPILISMMEKELIVIVKGSRILPYLETATSLMIAGYFIGVGSIDLWVTEWGNKPWVMGMFHNAIFYILITGAIGIFISLTCKASPPRK